MFQKSFLCFICTVKNHNLPAKHLIQLVMHLVPVGRLLLCQALWSNNNPANLFCKFSGLIGALLINAVSMGCAEKHLLMHYMKGSV